MDMGLRMELGWFCCQSGVGVVQGQDWGTFRVGMEFKKDWC